jgi:YD repeat-containing protein
MLLDHRQSQSIRKAVSRARPVWVRRAQIVSLALLPFVCLPAAAPVWDGAYPVTRITLLPSSGGSPKFSHSLAILKPTLQHDAPLNTFEVDLRSGAFVLRQTDIFVKDVMPLSLTRTYNVFDRQMRAFGMGTNHPYDVAPTGTRLPYTYLDINLEDGNSVHFPSISQGTGYADAVYEHSSTASEFFGARIAWNGNGWTMSVRNGFVFLFPEAYYSRSLAQGAATEIRNPQGRQIRLQRDAQRNLRRLISPGGRTIDFIYNGTRIDAAQDDRGRTVGYWYDDAGHLYAVTDNAKHFMRFSYDHDQMISVQDETGVLLRNSYDNGRVSQQTVADGSVYRYRYLSNREGELERTLVTMPDGAGVALSFDHGRLVSKDAIQGF